MVHIFEISCDNAFAEYFTFMGRPCGSPITKNLLDFCQVKPIKSLIFPINVDDMTLFVIYENTDFHWPIFSRTRTEL